MPEKTETDFMTNEQLLEEIKRLWREQSYREYEVAESGRDTLTIAEEYMFSDAEEWIDRMEKAYKARGLELPDRYEYTTQFWTDDEEEPESTPGPAMEEE